MLQHLSSTIAVVVYPKTVSTVMLDIYIAFSEIATRATSLNQRHEGNNARRVHEIQSVTVYTFICAMCQRKIASVHTTRWKSETQIIDILAALHKAVEISKIGHLRIDELL